MSKYGKILILICLSDLIITAVGIVGGFFGEMNPMLRWCLVKYGLHGFVAVKFFLNAVSIFTLEYFYRKIPREIVICYKATITIYLIVLLVGIVVQIV